MKKKRLLSLHAAKNLIRLSDGIHKIKFDKLFKGKNRIRISVPIETSLQSNPTTEKVSKVLKSKNFVLSNYIKGYCYEEKNPKNVLKIGKVLKSIDTDLLEEFRTDPVRSGEMDFIISRHPLDIALCSYEKQWDSCLNIDSGSNSHKTELSIQAGSVLVAYLVSKGTTSLADKKKIFSRVLIHTTKLFSKHGVESDDSDELYENPILKNTSYSHPLLIVSNQTYGLPVAKYILKFLQSEINSLWNKKQTNLKLVDYTISEETQYCECNTNSKLSLFTDEEFNIYSETLSIKDLYSLANSPLWSNINMHNIQFIILNRFKEEFHKTDILNFHQKYGDIYSYFMCDTKYYNQLDMKMLSYYYINAASKMWNIPSVQISGTKITKDIIKILCWQLYNLRPGIEIYFPSYLPLAIANVLEKMEKGKWYDHVTFKRYGSKYKKFYLTMLKEEFGLNEQ